MESLDFLHGALRQEQRSRQRLGENAHPAELARTHDFFGVGEFYPNFQCARGRVDEAIDENEAAAVRMNLAVG